MLRILTPVLAASVLATAPVLATESRKIFAGEYDGITEMENKTGKTIFYSPVRFKITRDGTISGTALRTSTGKLLKVKGSIGSVSSLFGIRFLGKASGTFSDGTRWTAEVEAMKGVSAKGIRGTARRDGYAGMLSLTNL